MIKVSFLLLIYSNVDHFPIFFHKPFLIFFSFLSFHCYYHKCGNSFLFFFLFILHSAFFFLSLFANIFTLRKYVSDSEHNLEANQSEENLIRCWGSPMYRDKFSCFHRNQNQIHHSTPFPDQTAIFTPADHHTRTDKYRTTDLVFYHTLNFYWVTCLRYH